MKPHGADAARALATAVRDRLGVTYPVAAIVLGSGLGALAERVERAVRMPYGELPGFPAAQVAGHRGALIAGTLAGREVLVFAGRPHIYEGHSARAAAFPVRVAHALGAPVLFTSNAAGGIRPTFRSGDLMIIEDHLNLTGRNPLIGPAEPTDDRFPDLSSPYAPRLIALLRAAAESIAIPITSGIYAGLLGPSYETPAEIRMLARLGADSVAMSTIPEVLVARALRMEVAAMSVIVNPAAGISDKPLSHADVLTASQAAANRFTDLVIAFVSSL